MYYSTFAHLKTDFQPPVATIPAPARRKARRGSATLRLWRNHPSPLRARVSQH